ncbi:hypothetical protein JCM8208_001939 [Rhodotorula glutinis]
MATPPCPIPPPLPPAAGARPPAPAHAVGHSYSASLPPTYRLSAFPVSPSAHDDGPGSTAFSTLAPGLGLEQRGCDSDDDDDHDRRRRVPSPPSPSSPSSSSAHRPTRTTRGFDCPASSSTAAGAAVAASSGTDIRSTSASSARSSSSCAGTSASTSTTTTEDDADADDCATPLSSLAGSTASMTASESCRAAVAPGPTTSLSSAAAPRPPPPTSSSSSNLAARLEWGMQGLVVAPQVPKDDAAKREREARAVRGGWEDPALAAARRALWDDVVAVDEDEGSRLGEDEHAQGEEGTAERRSGEVDGDVRVSLQRDDGAATHDDEDEDEEEDRGDDDEGLPRPRRPCHTTLAPRFSCLRHSPSARASLSLPSSSCPSSSDDGPLPPSASTSTSTSTLPTSGRLSPSAASTTSTSEGAPASVTFSCAPPETCPTWSAEAYSRRGDAPVEKLSIREWIELQGVREAVGVWSGKIAKWDEAQVLAEASAGAGADGQLSTPTRGRPPGGLAAVVGVVHISRSTPTSPVDPNRMPFP